MLRSLLKTWFLLSIPVYCSSELDIVNLHNNPIVLIKQNNCKLQTGTIKIIHPINLHQIEESIELLTTKFYTQLTPTNPMNEVVKYRIKKLYSSLYALKPQQTHRHKRWDSLGAAWKWIAGSPDAQDLQIINSTMNDIIDQNNQQYRVNENINNRISKLTQAINQIASALNPQNGLDVMQAITTMLNMDVINELLDNIQEAITLSRISVINNKILSTREINAIKTALQDQGVKINFPDEALQFVTPKIAVKEGDLLYILHVPELENATSTIVRIYPLIVNNQMIKSYPSHIIRRGPKLFETDKPEDFVQRSFHTKEFEDKCIRPLILGKQSHCTSVHKNETTQQLINENTLLISNAKNHTLESNCGPDNRTITGNFIIKFANCTVKFNNHKFHNSETMVDTEILHGAFHNILINWTIQNQPNIKEIHDTAINNRRKLDHVYLQQSSLRFNLWITFGGISLSTAICFIIIILILRNINPCLMFNFRKKQQPNVDPGRLELEPGVVTNAIEKLKAQQQQIAATLAAMEV